MVMYHEIAIFRVFDAFAYLLMVLAYSATMRFQIITPQLSNVLCLSWGAIANALI